LNRLLAVERQVGYRTGEIYGGKNWFTRRVLPPPGRTNTVQRAIKAPILLSFLLCE